MKRKLGEYSADPVGVIRFPVLSHDQIEAISSAEGQALCQLVNEVTDDKYVSEAIYLASPGLHKRMMSWKSGQGGFGDIPAAIARYLLRMAYRSTPFGTFSCVSSCSIGGPNTTLKLPNREGMHRHATLDSAANAQLAHLVETSTEARQDLTYFVNDTAHFQEDLVSFIAYTNSKSGKRIYRRVELERSEYLDSAVGIANLGGTPANIATQLEFRFPRESASDIHGFVNDLIDQQLLCADQLIDITSESSIRHLMGHLHKEGTLTETITATESTLQALSGSMAVDVPEAYESISVGLTAAGIRLARGSVAKVDLYAIGGDVGSLAADIVRKVEGVLNHVLTFSAPTALTNFVRIFEARFGESHVPLQVVEEELDSLGFMDRQTSTPALVKQVGSNRLRNTQVSGDEVTEALRQLGLNSINEKYIDLSTIKDFRKGNEKASKNISRTIIAWISLWARNPTDDGDPIIEIRSVGAQEPGRLMGRFGHGLPAVQEYLRGCVNTSLLPVVEIVHLPSDRLGNVCARPSLSNCELTIRGGGSADAKRISLSDLTVRVRKGRVVVRSKSLNSDIQLAMSNAHAFDRKENLPVYKFLNYVSCQEPHARLISLRSMFPTAPFVPGLKHDGVIVSRPSWRIVQSDIEGLERLAPEMRAASFTERMKTRGLPKTAALIYGDNVIPIKFSTGWMLEILLREIRKSGGVTVTDVAPEELVPHLASSWGRHHHEIQFALRTEHFEAPTAHETLAPHIDAVSHLWGEWSFWQLHVSPQNQNEVLRELQHHLEMASSDSKKMEYFFVRYRDEMGAHLRLRIKAAGDLEQTITTLRPILGELTRKRLIKTAAIVPYVRETSRYGGSSSCEHAERIFCLDSQAVLEVLPTFKPDTLGCWRLAAAAIDAMLISVGLISPSARLSFAKKAAHEFDSEMKFGPEQRKAIGKIHRSGEGPILLNEHDDLSCVIEAAPFYARCREISQIWEQLEQQVGSQKSERLYAIRWSLVHMRMNRLFEDNARVQEAIVWELLKRSYAGSLARASRIVEEAV